MTRRHIHPTSTGFCGEAIEVEGEVHYHPTSAGKSSKARDVPGHVHRQIHADMEVGEAVYIAESPDRIIPPAAAALIITATPKPDTDAKMEMGLVIIFPEGYKPDDQNMAVFAAFNAMQYIVGVGEPTLGKAEGTEEGEEGG